MSFNGAGVFLINSAGQPVVDGTVITAIAFNTFTADIATGLSTCITKDGQTTVTANIPFAGFKATGLGAATTNGDAIRYEQWLTGFSIHTCEFRLSGITGTAVPSTNLANIGTLYMAPYKGNRIALYDSANWQIYSTAEISIAVPAVASTMYDVYCYANAGVPTLEMLAWTNDTTRATALALQNGVYVKTGDATRRYLGTVRTDATNKLLDTTAFRWIWNYYNRVSRPMSVLEATASWGYTTAAFRQARASAANQLDFVYGVAEDSVKARVLGGASNTIAGVYITVGIGLDSTTVLSSSAVLAGANIPVTNYNVVTTAEAVLYPAAGRHYLAWLEYSSIGGATTWNGVSSTFQAGIVGEIFA